MTPHELNALLGNIDVYLLDQILKGRVAPGQPILDAGCGEGRNMLYFLRQAYPVFGVDVLPEAIDMVRFQAASLIRHYPESHFSVCNVDALPYADGFFATVVCCAVLHFATDEGHFDRMWAELARVLAPGGLLFIRTVVDTGMADDLLPVDDSLCQLPDGSVRFVLREGRLPGLLEAHGLRWVEPFKAVVVDGARCMGTLVLTK